MTQIKKYNLNETQINHFVVDIYSGNYIWILFVNRLKKVSANNPLQTYFNIETSETLIKGAIYSTSLYVAIDDSTIIGRRFSLINPLTTTLDYNKPVGANESPIDIQITANYVFFLLPGNLSGENAKIYKFTLNGTYVETIDLVTIQNVSSFVVIDDTNLWAVTNTSPSELVRIYNDGSWNYETF